MELLLCLQFHAVLHFVLSMISYILYQVYISVLKTCAFPKMTVCCYSALQCLLKMKSKYFLMTMSGFLLHMCLFVPLSLSHFTYTVLPTVDRLHSFQEFFSRMLKFCHLLYKRQFANFSIFKVWYVYGKIWFYLLQLI